MGVGKVTSQTVFRRFRTLNRPTMIMVQCETEDKMLIYSWSCGYTQAIKVVIRAIRAIPDDDQGTIFSQELNLVPIHAQHILSSSPIKILRNCSRKEKMFKIREQSESIMGRTFALLTANLGVISRALCGPLSTVRSDLEVQSQNT